MPEAPPDDRSSAQRRAARSPYTGSTALLATMHDKLPLIAPVMKDVIGLEVRGIDVDTDRFGTFSGERPRKGTPFETAVAKARCGMLEGEMPIGLASEGSFGPSPVLPFVTADVETMVLVDDRLGIVVVETALSHDVITVATDLDASAPDLDAAVTALMARADFPQHGLIVRSAAAGRGPVTKGIHEPAALFDAIARCARAVAGPVRVETDLRAHHCPSRRPVIEAAARRLAERLSHHCPGCDAPGWGVVGTRPGAPCSECGLATAVTLAEVLGCVRCEVTQELVLPAAAGVDPARCPRCNA